MIVYHTILHKYKDARQLSRIVIALLSRSALTLTQGVIHDLQSAISLHCFRSSKKQNKSQYHLKSQDHLSLVQHNFNIIIIRRSSLSPSLSLSLSFQHTHTYTHVTLNPYIQTFIIPSHKQNVKHFNHHHPRASNLTPKVLNVFT